MPRDLTHAVLEGLDEAKSTGGLVIMKKKKKEGEEEEKGGFKLPVGPSKLGLDRYESLSILGNTWNLWSLERFLRNCLFHAGWLLQRRRRGGTRS